MNVPHADGRPLQPYRFALTRVTDDANLAESLRRVADAGCELVKNCASASVTLVAAGRPLTMAATDEVATEMDQAQYDMDDGPCLTAARQERTFRIEDLAAHDRWPMLREVGRRHGVASTLSVPLQLEDADMYGAVNLYSTARHGFSDDDATLAEGFAQQAAVVVANVVAYWAAFDLSRNLKAAMEHRGVIEQAKGIMMAATRCSPDEAFEMLRKRSQVENRKLRDIAIEVVQRASSDS